MITPAEIKRRARKIWDSGRFLTAWCDGENIFPLEFPAGSISGSGLSDNYSAAGRWIDELVSGSKSRLGSGYTVQFSTVSHRQLGNQTIPQRVIIEADDDFHSICGTGKDFKIFRELYGVTAKSLPDLLPFVRSNPLVLINIMHDWSRLLSVCRFFIDNPEPSIYIRQITIPGIDTKFIERNKRILLQMMCFLRPEIYGDRPVPLAGNGFEKSLGLLYDEALVRFRILDRGLYLSGLSDISLTLSEFESLNLPAARVFITENKINGLAFPDVKSSIVIFGLGYGISMLEQVRWLKEKSIFYWGDIDTHGFSILSMVRNIFPQCISLLMDEDTLLMHRDAWVEEPEAKRFIGELTRLHQQEKELFVKLQNNFFGRNVRLEQELVSFNLLLELLKKNGCID